MFFRHSFEKIKIPITFIKYQKKFNDPNWAGEIILHCDPEAETVEVAVLLDEAAKDDDVAEADAKLLDPDPGFPVNDIMSVLDK